MGSDNLHEVKKLLAEFGFTAPFTVSNRSIDQKVIIVVSSDDVEEKVRSGKTSVRQLKNVVSKLASHFDKNVEYLISKGQVQEQHEMLITTAISKNIGASSTCNVRNRNKNEVDVVVRVEAAGEDVEGLVEGVNAIVEKYFGLLNIEARISTEIVTVTNLPNLVNILSLVKVMSPISVEQMNFGDEFSVPSIKWLSKELDKLRKHGMLIRQKSGAYALTELGLRVAPHGTTRSSTDVARALFLAHRRW